MSTRTPCGFGPFTRRPALIAAVVLLAFLGCAESGEAPHERSPRFGSRPDAAAARAASAPAPVLAMASAPAEATGPPAVQDAARDAVPTSPAPRVDPVRKVIYTAAVDLATPDLARFEGRLYQLIDAQGAFIADSDRAGAAGSTRRGRWKVRVPIDRYDAFVRGVAGLGDLIRSQAQSQDVGAEYYDTDARTAAKKAEEARLLKHLADSTSRLDEILTIERELTRVRGEIEQLQGRLNYLGNLTALATVTVSATEVEEVTTVAPPAIPPPVPPPPLASTLGERVVATFGRSLALLRNLGEATLILLAALAPWLPLLILGGYPLVIALRRASATPAISRAAGAASGD